MRSKLLLAPYIFDYKASRILHIKPWMPINITCSVTNRCNSRCLTCNVWKIYIEKPELQKDEFKTGEFDQTFQSIGRAPFWITMSGGEPFLRKDLAQICEAAYHHCQPAIINIPTNGILTDIIPETTKEISEKCPKTSIVINVSLDGIGFMHDEIRRIPGNFDKLLETYQILKKLQDEFQNLEIGIHSVVSKFNVDKLLETYEYAKQLEPDSYITEVAEERSELFTINSGITPDLKKYEDFIQELTNKMKHDSLASKKVSKTTKAFRLVYYKIATQVLKEKKQVIPCYAGYASCQISPLGEVWPCCILGYEASIGNLRNVEYNFKKIWQSEKAYEIRKHIRDRTCYCPLANAHYTSILCNLSSMLKVVLNMA
jgi:MoaA/NifB/PqqE/SkfB family radical SAM enzyme